MEAENNLPHGWVGGKKFGAAFRRPSVQLGPQFPTFPYLLLGGEARRKSSVAS